MIIYLNISETSSDVISLEEETDEAEISEEVYDENETASDDIIPDKNEEIVSEDDAADYEGEEYVLRRGCGPSGGRKGCAGRTEKGWVYGGRSEVILQKE